ncbi:hypothetical protein D3C76_1019050 [compost metagenome]
MLRHLSGARVVSGALFQAIQISAAAYAEINIAVRIEVDVRIWPLRGYVDAVGANGFAPPGYFHEKLLIWKQEPMIRCTASGRHPTFVYPMLHIPEDPQFACAIFRIMDGCTG